MIPGRQALTCIPLNEVNGKSVAGPYIMVMSNLYDIKDHNIIIILLFASISVIISYSYTIVVTSSHTNTNEYI